MNSESLRHSLMTTGQYIARGPRLGDWPWRRAPVRPVEGLAPVAALVRLSELCGSAATAEQLIAGLPLPAGRSLDMRLAPIALARVGLQAEPLDLAVAALTADQCPALLLLHDDSVLILRAVQGESLTVIGAQGEQILSLAHVAGLASGSGFVIGQTDPVVAGDGPAARDAMLNNPKRWMLAQFLAERRLVVQLAATAILLNLCAFVVPLFLRSVYDRVVPNLAMETLWALALGVMLALLFEFGLKGVRATFVDAIAIRVGLMVQHKVMNSLLRARTSAAPTQSGAVLSILRDVEAMATLIPNGIITFLIDIPFFVLFLVIIGSIGGIVTLVTLAGGLCVAAAGFWAHNALARYSQKSSELTRARNNLVVDSVEGLVSIKAARARGRFLGYWDLLADHQALSQRQIRHYTDKPGSLAALAMQLVTVGIIIVGVYQLREGSITVGGLVACTMLAGRAMVPVSSAVQILSRMQQSLSVFAGLSRLLALEPEPDAQIGHALPQSVEGTIRFSNVSLTYGADSQPVLQQINLTLTPGERVAFIGRSGAGKSTLLHLIAGLLQPSDGQITIDGVDLRQFPADQLRQSMAYAPQDALLFDGQLQENILLSGAACPPERLATVMNATGVAQFCKPHPEGVRLNVGPRGNRLSGGQRQSVVLARALVEDSPILLLDEPTAAMDVGTEMQVMQGLAALTQGRTLVLATHRMPLLDLVDRVIWIEDGRIVADKPRAEMLAFFKAQQARAANAA